MKSDMNQTKTLRIKYKIKEVSNNIFAIVVPDKYDLAMLFCRVQEFYESQNKKIRNKKFSIWEYYAWYSKKHSGCGCFSYPADWSGFNLPAKIANDCYKINKVETPYDIMFLEILKNINIKDGYIIGVEKIGTDTYWHEFCHGLYYTNKIYKRSMDELTKSLSFDCKKKLSKNLKKLGYCSAVVNDEIQAYMSTEINKKITKGLQFKRKIHNEYKNIFNEFA